MGGREKVGYKYAPHIRKYHAARAAFLWKFFWAGPILEKVKIHSMLPTSPSAPTLI